MKDCPMYAALLHASSSSLTRCFAFCNLAVGIIDNCLEDDEFTPQQNMQLQLTSSDQTAGCVQMFLGLVPKVFVPQQFKVFSRLRFDSFDKFNDKA